MSGVTDRGVLECINNRSDEWGGHEVLVLPIVDRLIRAHLSGDYEDSVAAFIEAAEANDWEVYHAICEDWSREGEIEGITYIVLCSSCAEERDGTWTDSPEAKAHTGMCPYCEEEKLLCHIKDCSWPDSKRRGMREWRSVSSREDQ